jgi:hypothetical protein
MATLKQNSSMLQGKLQETCFAGSGQMHQSFAAKLQRMRGGQARGSLVVVAATLAPRIDLVAAKHEKIMHNTPDRFMAVMDATAVGML